jgi:hypothetical protein
MESFRILGPTGEVQARDSLVVALFLCRPYATIAKAASRAIDSWLDIVPQEFLKWTLVGTHSTRYRKFSAATLKRMRAEIDQDAPRVERIYASVAGPEAFGPDYKATIKGYAKPKKIAFADETNLIEFVFPPRFLATYGRDRFAMWTTSVFCDLEAYSGYASPALCFGVRGAADEAAPHIFPRALQHPGMDVPNNQSTATSMGCNRCRGARWLTLLSTRLMTMAGGLDTVRSRLAQGVELRELPCGVLVRAGKEPEIGWVNRNEGTPLLASVAHAIEAITFFGDDSLLPIFANDEAKRDRWERRFWRS